MRALERATAHSINYTWLPIAIDPIVVAVALIALFSLLF
jgi:hypothetical protein